MGEPETNEAEEDPAKESVEAVFSYNYTSEFEPLVDYSHGANRTVQYKLWAICRALSRISATLEES